MNKARKFLFATLICLMTIFGTFGFASCDWNFEDFAWEDDGVLYYNLNEDGKSYSVMRTYNRFDKEIVIPATFKGLPVTMIEERAFSTCLKLESVVIGDSVTTVGQTAFENCYNLKSVVISDSVTTIGDYAFALCHSLVSVQMSNNVTQIGSGLFSNCTNLVDVKIPDGVTTIGSCAFEYCTRLPYVEIPDSVQSIGEKAFRYCKNLTSVEIGDGITMIDEYTFYKCDSLTNVIIPDNVEMIGDYAFEDCDRLTNVEIGKKVTEIGYRAFADCGKLDNVRIPDNVMTLRGEVFSNCDSLTNVEIGAGVTVGVRAFEYCENLTSISVSANNPCYQSIDGNIYTKNGNTLVQYAIGKTAESFTIPTNVTKIGDEAFSGCNFLKYVKIGDNVTTIGYRAFYWSSLTSVEIGKGVIRIEEDAFNGLKNIYYKGTAEEWTKISISDNNYYLTNATRYYYVENEADVPTDGGNYWHYDENGEIVVW